MPLAIIQQFAQLRYAVVNIVYTITSRQLRRRQTHRGTSPLGVMRSQTVKLRCPAAAAAEISSDATGLLDSHKRLVERRRRRRLQLVVDLLTGSLA